MSRFQPRWVFVLAAAVIFYFAVHLFVAMTWGAGA